MENIPIGAPAADVIIHLVKLHTNIASIKFIQYPPLPTFKQVSRKTSLTLEQALSRRLRHGGKMIHMETLARAEVTSPFLGRLIEELPAEAALAVCSEVILRSGKPAHVPLIDFQCAKSRKNLEFLSAAFSRIEPKGGVILASANSYHFYGMSLLSHAEWYRFVGRCLLLEPLVDVRYLGHCLLDGFAALRISRQGQSLGRPPFVVAYV
jgi:hypothetical protein